MTMPALCEGHLDRARNVLRDPKERRASWDRYENLREHDVRAVIAASWADLVHRGRIRLCDVPTDCREFVRAQLVKHAQTVPPTPPKPSTPVNPASRFFGGR